MGFISRNVFPACETMCVCCPALRPRSKHPAKRYKKLLGEIFPKSPDGAPNERKIVKLCEYAAKNPIRIPKIAKILEERCYKDLRSEQMKFINIVTEAYNKMLCHCKDQMAYFATSLLNVVTELLENSKEDTPTILGCQTLTRFIYNQVDGTYTHSIEKFAHKVCSFAREQGDEHQKQCLRASGLQCLSAMVWFMGEFSHIFAAFDEIVHAILDNYEANMIVQTNEDREEQNCNWVNEVIRCEGRGIGVSGCNSPSYMVVRPRTAGKDPTLLTKEEAEMPKVWAQICLQRMVDLAKESTTLRRILDPMFSYFNSRRQWTPPNGLAMIVLSDATYMMETSGSQQLVLSTVVRHLDNKHVANDPELKAYIIQVAGCLAKLIRTSSYLRDISFVNDLCRHLRKSFQATSRSVEEEELNLNVMLQNSIEDCLREIAKGIGNAQPLFDMMAVLVEGLPSSGVVSRAAVGSLLILAHAMSSALSPSMRSQQVFPDTLLDALLKAMLHPNVETRVGAHEIFSVILLPSSGQSQAGLASVRASGYLNESKNLRSDTTSAFTSIAARLDKLRKEKDGVKVEKNGYNEDLKNYKSSPNFHKLNSMIDRTAGGVSLADMLPSMMKFTEDQMGQLLSAFWTQATLPDNLPTSIEAIAHSLSLVLLSLRLKNPDDGLVVRAFQLLFSLRNLSLDLNNGTLPTVCKRLILALSTSTLMFAAKIYQIPHICKILKSQLPGDVDPYLFIGDDLQLHVKPHANMKDFGSSSDSQMATSMLFEMRSKVELSNTIITDVVAKNLSKVSKLQEADVQMQLSEPFTPDDAFMFGSRPIVESGPNQSISKESLSFDEDVPAGSVVEDEVTSELSVRFQPRGSPSSSTPQVISIGQLMESALEVAGQVVVSSVSTSPLPYDTMTNRCETFGTGTRQKLSRWLATENRQVNGLYRNSSEESSALEKVTEDGSIYGRECGVFQDTWSMMSLPPASPFDNFLKAAGAGR
ncbi:protein SEMI-ROLLED LEAF 2-like [Brassica napus]|uniref:protein SEMI-ROLLED LEAF 2-like n=1 Tax=Brassica napus TaxID=3708 RepID=UPI002078EF2F|nr:protein SEMI-ROLLED LEAF 2-like [Brassica napus]